MQPSPSAETSGPWAPSRRRGNCGRLLIGSLDMMVMVRLLRRQGLRGGRHDRRDACQLRNPPPPGTSAKLARPCPILRNPLPRARGRWRRARRPCTIRRMVAPTPIPLADGFPDALQALRAQMVDLTLRHVDGDGTSATAIPCLQLIKASCSTPKTAPALYEPGLAIVLQGRKKVELGTETLYYDPLHFLLVSMPMLPKGGVIEATPDKPYLCVR